MGRVSNPFQMAHYSLQTAVGFIASLIVISRETETQGLRHVEAAFRPFSHLRRCVTVVGADR